MFLVHIRERGLVKMTMKEINYAQKKTGEELQLYLHFRRRGAVTPAKKGKCPYSRKQKHKENLI